MKTKEQKLAQVDELVRKLGLTRGEVVDYLITEKTEAPKIRGDIAKTTKSVKQNEIFNDIANYLKNKYPINRVFFYRKHLIIRGKCNIIMIIKQNYN